MFAEKLNFLMNITATQNSMLAFAVSLDASHISRLRHGSRRLPKNESFVMPMAKYFARNITDSFQKKTLADVLHLKNGYPKDEELASDILYKWLLSNETESSTDVSTFLMGFSSTGKASQNSISDSKIEFSYEESKNNFYYGNEGKREAVIRFLSNIVKEKEPQTLLLFSDEDMSWLNEDLEFARKWTSLLLKVLQMGNKIKIIHTISRNSDEMMEALTKWLPIYMTGAVQSYYYPKLRDGVFKRTMFIAPKTAAVISNSVKNDTSEMLNIYVDTPFAIASVETEFSRFMSMCRPLMTIMNAVSRDRFWKEFADFQSIEAPTILLTQLPSLMTMPEDIVKKVSLQCAAIDRLWKNSQEKFRNVIAENKFIEILTPVSLKEEQIPLPMSDMHTVSELFYTKEDYRHCLENVLEIAKNNPNYVAVYTETQLQGITIYAKEDVGVLIMKQSAPTTVFAFREPNITATVWSYLSDMAELLAQRQKNNEAIKKIITSIK